MPTNETYKAPTRALMRQYRRGIAALDSIHRCEYDKLTVHIYTPGFVPPDYVGSSMWVCDECRPMVASIMTRCYGGYVIKERGIRR